MDRLREILQLVLLRAALGVLLLLRLDRHLTLLRKEQFTIGLVLLVLAHDLVELRVRVLHVLHEMLGRLPRQPAAHTADHQIILRVLALENLAPQLSLLVRRECAADLDAADIALEAIGLVERLLHLLLMLEEKYLVLFGDIRLLDVLTMRLLEIVNILHDIIDLDGILLGNVVSQMLQTLHLEIVVRPLHEVLKKEILLALNHLLGRDEGHNAVALVGQLGILIEVVHHAVLVHLRKLNLLAIGAHLYFLSTIVKTVFSRSIEQTNKQCWRR